MYKAQQEPCVVVYKGEGGCAEVYDIDSVTSYG
jgi:hypothetical protein